MCIVSEAQSRVLREGNARGFLGEVEPRTQLLFGLEFFRTIFPPCQKETSTKTPPKKKMFLRSSKVFLDRVFRRCTISHCNSSQTSVLFPTAQVPYMVCLMCCFCFFCQGSNHPICPVFLGDARLASEFADEMLGLHL